MAFLRFEAGGQRYALDALDIVEVVPAVGLHPPPSAPPVFAGFLAYRGAQVPVLDLCQLLAGTPATSGFSTRILLVQLTIPGASRQLVGLRAERVLEVAETLEEPILGSAVLERAAGQNLTWMS